jgi:predicted dehydrogenase
MNRRKFLSQSSAAALAIGAQGIRPVANRRIRIAFLGGSHSHAFDKAKIVHSSPEYELAGVWEESAEVFKQYAELGIKPISRDEALRDESIAVIAVESDVKENAALGKMALEAGKHVHLEKPMAANLDISRQLVSLAERHRLLLQLGYMWRNHQGFKAALEAARQGWLGEVYLVRGMMNTLIAAARRPEWARFKGGQMFEQGGHLIDPIARLLGRPEKVTPFLRKHGRYDDTLMDNTIAVLEYPRAMALVQSSTLQPGAGSHRAFEIQGTNGTAVLRPIEPATMQLDLAREAGPYKAGKQTISLPVYRRYQEDFVELAAALRGEKPLSVSLQEEMVVQETLLRACEM